MSRPTRLRQQGFGLLSFVAVTAFIALSLVVGYSGLLTRKVANELELRQEAKVGEVVSRLEAMWLQHAGQLHLPSSVLTVTPQTLTEAAGMVLPAGVQMTVSDVLPAAAEGLVYRNVVVYLPAETDEVNPPDLPTFVSTGVFKSCTNSAAECAPRVFKVFSSLDLQREFAREAQLRLNKVASKAQSYFKARLLQDIERNIDVNYFYRPSGGCAVEDIDLGCLTGYEPLATESGGVVSRSRLAQRLSLNDEELFSPWGGPIEAANVGQGNSTSEAPFSMSFRVVNPAGGYYIIRAVQPL